MAMLFRRLRFIQRFEIALLVLATLLVALASEVANARELARRQQTRNHLFQHSGDHGDTVELDPQLHVVKVGSCPLCSQRHPIPYCYITRGPTNWETVPWWALPEQTRQEALRLFGIYKSTLRYRDIYDGFQARKPPKPQ